MTLLFIENRYKTFYFEAIAKQLIKHGFDIHFLVQNKSFEPNNEFVKHIIPYPKNSQYNYTKDIAIETVIESDRQQNHFGKKDKSYFYYYDSKIKTILDTVKPDVVFGESTAFHELLAINLCKENKILYLNPSSCRYPIGRFSFYKYDTLKPYKGSSEVLERTQALDIIDGIVNRTAKPDYMNAINITKKAKIFDKIKLVIAYLDGERFNIPNPVEKYNIEKQREKNIAIWDDFAKAELASEKFTILYPLQMQPEANIDVWGRPYRDQTQLIKKISETIPENSILVLKPNPKSKYELSNDLVSLAKAKNNIICLKHATKMDAVFPKIDLVVTVTGTIAIESILSNKPVATFIKTLNNTAENCLYLNEISDLNEVIDLIKKNNFPTLDENSRVDFINKLNTSSYKGIVSDPFSNVNCVSVQNIKNMEDAFLKILK